MADTIDQQFIEYIAKTLVENPDEVKVEREIDERGVLLQLHVAPDDLGRVIGRGGSTAKSIRTLLRALSVKNDARYNLKIVDTGDGQPAASDDQAASEDQAPAGSEEAAVDQTEEDTATGYGDEESAEPDTSEESQEDQDEEESDYLARSRKDLADLTDDLDEE